MKAKTMNQNLYLCIYKTKKLEIRASSALQARQLAAQIFKANSLDEVTASLKTTG